MFWKLQALVLMALAVPLTAMANPPSASVRPVIRPAPPTEAAAPVVKASFVSVRPVSRPASRSHGGVTAPISRAEPVAAGNLGFRRWMRGCRNRARGAGISGTVFERGLRVVKDTRDVIQKDRNQSEFTKTIWD